MTPLQIIQLSLAALGSMLAIIKQNGAAEKVISEVEAAIASLENVQQKITDLDELESLRTQKTW